MGTTEDEMVGWYQRLNEHEFEQTPENGEGPRKPGVLQSMGLSRVFSSTKVQKHQLFSAQLPSQSNSHIHTQLLEKP